MDNASLGGIDGLEKCGIDCADFDFLGRYYRKVLPFAPTPDELQVVGYDGSFDGFPMLVSMMASSKCHQKNFAECRVLTNQASTYSGSQFMQPGLKETFANTLRQLEAELAAFDPLSPGSYVTNKGVLQSWIGKVISRSGDLVSVYVTYARSDAGFSKSSELEVDQETVKPLRAISLDAMKAGWQ